MDETLIHLAVTRGPNRFVVSGSFELYSEFMQSSLPAIGSAETGKTLETIPRSQARSLSRKWQAMFDKMEDESSRMTVDERRISLAITRGRNRLAINGSFDLYGEFMHSSLPAIRTGMPNKAVASAPASEEKPRSKKWQGLWIKLLGGAAKKA